MFYHRDKVWGMSLGVLLGPLWRMGELDLGVRVYVRGGRGEGSRWARRACLVRGDESEGHSEILERRRRQNRNRGGLALVAG